jgi:flavin-dependent dehydrogenase
LTKSNIVIYWLVIINRFIKVVSLKNEVSIIGAATAGLIAAKRLAGYGLEVAVYDQKRTPGVPVRASGILSISGLSTLGIDYSGSITNTLYGANVHCGGKTMRIISQKPVAHILDRHKLNVICMDEAAGAGAKIETGKRISGSGLDRMRGSGVIIGADGAVSTVATHFSLGSVERLLLTYKAEFNVDIQDPTVVDLFFDNVKYRGLFAWLAPNARDILEVGIGIDSGAGNARAAFDRLLREPEVRELLGAKRPISQSASVIPMGLRKRFVDENNGVLLVGDAAGQVKPTTGGGIIFGGNASIMAAETVYRYLNGIGRLSDYENSFRRAYGLDLGLHRLINRLYTSLSPRSVGVMIDVMNTFGIDRFLGAYGDMDRPSLVMKRFFLRSLV